MANAIAGVGTTFERWSGSAWVAIAEINSIDGPGMDKEVIDVTSLDTDGGFDEFITGFLDGGTLSLNMNFTRSGYELMKSDFEVDVARNYRIVLPDDEATTLEFDGLVTEIPLTMEAEDKLTADVTIQITSDVTLASAGAESSEVVDSSVDTSESGYEDELNTYISGLSTPLSDGQKTLLNNLILAIKSELSIANLSDAFDAIYILAGETEESSLRNLVKNAHHCTNQHSTLFTALEGFTGDGANDYLDTNYNPSSDKVNFAQNSASLGVYIRTSATPLTTTSLTALSQTGAAALGFTWVNTQLYYSLNDSSDNNKEFSGAGSGLFTITRNNSTQKQLHKNKTSESAVTANSSTISSGNIFILARDLVGTGADRLSVRQISMFYIAKGLSQANVYSIVDAFEAYMDANSKGVI